MALEIGSESVICFRCGMKYGKRKDYFIVSYTPMNKGLGYLPYCKKCINELFTLYKKEFGSAKEATRFLCRKLDVYWNEAQFDRVEQLYVDNAIISQYLSRLSRKAYAGKCYDDTLKECNALLDFPGNNATKQETENPAEEGTAEEEYEISDEVKEFWGPGYTNAMYMELEQRRQYWMSRLPATVDIGTEAIIRQICSLEIDINRDRAAGKSVDKNINALNTLLGSANLKPVQQKDDGDTELEKMPLGVGIQRWENYRPLPPVKESQKDVNKHIKTVLVWFTGHLCKMAGVKHSYSRMYEEEVERLRVKRPDIEEEDDEEFLSKFFSDSGGDG